MTKMISEKKLKFEITGGKKKERIDTYLANSIEHFTRSKIQKLIKAGLVTVNNKIAKANHIVVPGDFVEVTIPISPRPEETQAEDIPLNIVYEDEYLLIINKPAGMVVHPAFGNHSGTLVNALLHYTNNLSALNEKWRAGIIHRIDKETSGLLLIAKDEWVHSELAKQFAEHSIDRKYHAIVWGVFKNPEGEIIGNIARSKKDRKIFTVSTVDGKHSHTFYKVLEEFEFASYCELQLKTGRTHQIRVHMSSINHPVFGDPTYGGRKIVYGSNLAKMKSRVDNLLKIMTRQALHAKTLGFFHPVKKERMIFNSDLPQDILDLIAGLKN